MQDKHWCSKALVRMLNLTVFLGKHIFNKEMLVDGSIMITHIK